jgi:hypothetical protein
MNGWDADAEIEDFLTDDHCRAAHDCELGKKRPYSSSPPTHCVFCLETGCLQALLGSQHVHSRHTIAMDGPGITLHMVKPRALAEESNQVTIRK